MLNELVARLPTAGELLALTAEQLDGILLQCIAGRVTSVDPIAAKTVHEAELFGLYPIGLNMTYEQGTMVDTALMESWQRLEAGGLIVQAPGQAARVMTLTTRGKAAAADSAPFKEITVRQRLSREMLHEELQGTVYKNFAGGNYDTAVRDAFVLVEIAVRDAAHLPNTSFGVRLMREAFDPISGALTNRSLPRAEQERIADLFAGAIGTFKNPLSHRSVGNADPALVMEELMFASRLLRFVK